MAEGEEAKILNGIPEDFEGRLNRALFGEKRSPLAVLLSAIQQLLLASGNSGSALELKKVWDEAFEEYCSLLLARTPREVVGQKRLYYRSELLNGRDHEPDAEDRVQCKKEEANLVGSLCEDGKHRPVLDIDHGVQLVPSSTTGHYHLYLDTAMSWESYVALLEKLRDSGVLSSFFVKAALIRGQTFVRVPWVKKQKEVVER